MLGACAPADLSWNRRGEKDSIATHKGDERTRRKRVFPVFLPRRSTLRDMLFRRDAGLEGPRHCASWSAAEARVVEDLMEDERRKQQAVEADNGKTWVLS